MKRIAWIAGVAVLLVTNAGCGLKETTSTAAAPAATVTNAPPAPGEPSPSPGIVGSMLQQDALQAGRRAQDKIKKIEASHNRDLDEAGGGK